MPIIYRDENIRNRISDYLLSSIKNDENYYRQNKQLYFDKLDQSSAKIGGATIKSIFHPYVLSSEEFLWVKEKVETLWDILEKTAELLVKDKKVAAFFDFPENFLELLAVDPGYKIKIPITRFDAFFHPLESIFFCEFNTDGTSGMNETNTMENCFLETDLGAKIQELYKLQQCELKKNLLKTLLDCYKEYGGNDKPNIAIVDFLDKATLAEFEALKETFLQEGYNTIICDPRDVKFHDNKLWLKDFQIDLVYRRAVTADLLERYDEIGDFIRAYKNNAFCMVGSFRSEGAHSKLAFTFLTSPIAEEYFSREEMLFIKNHLPATFRLSSDNQTLLEELHNDKDLYIIKPHNRYGGQGLYMGKNCSRIQWQNAITDNIDKNYIAQKLIKVPEETFITGSGEATPFKINLSPYLYGGKLKGFYTRVSDIDIITTSLGGAVVPTFVANNP